jgi:perosamine synthetase
MKNKKIPFSKPDILPKDLSSVSKVIKSGWLTHGPFTSMFEEEFAKLTKSNYATTVGSCTAGLHLACLALDIGAGDEVIVPAQTHTATAHAVEYTGAKAVFADIDYYTGNISIKEILKKITSRTKLIIPVHMAGLICEIREIIKIAKNRNIQVLEDCAHALGSKINNVHAGNFGIAGSFSFYPTKQITTGEGGMVISNDKKFLSKVKKLKQFGIDTPIHKRKKPGLYDVTDLGFNYRMTDFQAALGLGQIRRYEKNLFLRKRNAELYSKNLKGNKYLDVLDYNKNCSYFIFQILSKSSIIRNKIIKKLKSNNIGFGIHYATPVPLLNYYKKKYNYKANQFLNSYLYSNNVLSLPTHSGLSKNDIHLICKTIIDSN